MNLKPSVAPVRASRTSATLRSAVTGVACLAVLSAPTEAQQLDPDLVRIQCEAIHEIEDQSIIFGLVKDGRSGLPIPGGVVRLEWVTVSGIADSTFNTADAGAANGAYIFCDVPQDTRLQVFATALGGRSGREDFYFEAGESARRDLEVFIAQIEGGIGGRLTDSETEDAIVGATISVTGTDASALSNRNGDFSISDVPVGRQELLIRHVAYGEPRVPVTVENGQSTHVEVVLEPRAIAVEPLSVEISRRPLWLESNGFYERQERSLGQFVTPEMIEQRSFARFSEVLQQVPGVIVRTICTPRCFERIAMSGATQTGCIPTFYMDGRLMHVRPAPRTSRLEPAGLIDLDGFAPPHDLAAVEVYRSISETPPQYYGRCGSIVIWTKRGTG
ncbi:MAG: carboxypeptidase-like regulatory domain-containing protein [Gemmatimonadota bacterium]|nr:carboxypeptidase-like regulatory domain-containing protein [Gemmatimonadota bacterium]